MQQTPVDAPRSKGAGRGESNTGISFLSGGEEKTERRGGRLHSVSKKHGPNDLKVACRKGWKDRMKSCATPRENEREERRDTLARFQKICAIH